MEMRCRPKLADKSISIFTLYSSIYRTLPPRPAARFRKGKKHGWKVDVSSFFTFPHCNRWYTGYPYCPLFQLGTMHYLSCCSGCCFVGPRFEDRFLFVPQSIVPIWPMKMQRQWRDGGEENDQQFPQTPQKDSFSHSRSLSLAHALASTLVKV